MKLSWLQRFGPPGVISSASLWSEHRVPPCWVNSRPERRTEVFLTNVTTTEAWRLNGETDCDGALEPSWVWLWRVCLISLRPCARHRTAELSSDVEELSAVGEGEGRWRLAAWNWACRGSAADSVGLIALALAYRHIFLNHMERLMQC